MPKVYLMRLESPANLFEVTPLDNQYLKEYDPERDGIAPNGEIMLAHVTATHNKAEAYHFKTVADLLATWKQTCKRMPIRPDGQPNRYLTYWTITVEVYNTDAPN